MKGCECMSLTYNLIRNGEVVIREVTAEEIAKKFHCALSTSKNCIRDGYIKGYVIEYSDEYKISKYKKSTSEMYEFIKEWNKITATLKRVNHLDKIKLVGAER
jgi:hypothetical protein